MLPQKDQTRLSQACSYCRKRKVKCDGSNPCGNCLDHRQQCIYPPAQRRGRKNHGRRIHIVNDSITFSPPALPPTNLGGNETGSFRNLTIPSGSGVGERAAALSPHLPNRRASCARISDAETIVGPVPQLSATPITSPVCAGDPQTILVPQGMQPTPEEPDVDQEDVTMELNNSNWQHHGPSSWLSICSVPGVEWVASRADTAKFGPIAHSLVMDSTKHLTLAQLPTRERYPEPDFDRAWRYVTSYFDHSHDSMLGIICRAQFESQLQLHFQGQESDDVGRYALRNAVYAVGCRVAAVKDKTETFEDTVEISLQYFHNALSVYSDLLLLPSGLTAIHALIVMTSYVELLRGPAIEYMLCASAARLAQAKGLHREPSRQWRLPAAEVLHRNWTFWAVYCLEKYIALRSGRPSVLDDDDISCRIPKVVPEGSTIDIEVFTAVIKHARICSQMLRQHLSVKGFSQPHEIIFENIQIFERKLREWRASLPQYLLSPEQNALEDPWKSFKRRVNAVRLQNAYDGSIVALHANIHYPWVCSLLLSRTKSSFRERISHSSAEAAEASRRILASLKDWVIDLTSPSTMVIYYPLLAIVNLFIYILKNPAADTVQSDLALLDIGAGHFGHVHLLTSFKVSFSFPRDVARVAQRAARKALTEVSNAGREEADAFTSRTFPADLSDVPNASFGESMLFEIWDTLPADFFDNLSAAGDMHLL
ncbi:fungal-specific transcription factor domain-containing protein [Aspergillus carlsbadensis]|nr:fungal-specific transcription factor domain-containing protein [Aspergillus carlsbadensis]